MTSNMSYSEIHWSHSAEPKFSIFNKSRQLSRQPSCQCRNSHTLVITNQNGPRYLQPLFPALGSLQPGNDPAIKVARSCDTRRVSAHTRHPGSSRYLESKTDKNRPLSRWGEKEPAWGRSQHSQRIHSLQRMLLSSVYRRCMFNGEQIKYIVQVHNI